ncbi:MAG: PTS fructose transporter subunit IIA [Planctomycetes bacterium RIFCSPHIGHO2_02_FULL_50_42]|nr:PTS sugar transporter subunit IIA [Candidatus Brocadiales bacterium]OHB38317.1 MAG: PTS fructose transporter subunit IIA [Planctomycetes bacterium GWA2_50_13]OHB88602.1 MAG: PTS fructose transporter subunit IIA [Planctomycetes bacterium RIFCSPHIGHO2_02_FULL_50_42]OHB96607.1 MAG: PTS fructose transporter subunit IIA [Planctomycetes bacterium RIFCSPLOWO2_02_FULL_50_16]OHC03594.1 MAG: PTS fructose transporter subunit IIA [Planctomycetes bacterium RIFCSPLOWO2_12_FULL_50_35]HCN20106.1 PTS fructo
MKLVDFLAEEAIIYSLKVRDKKSAIKEMVEALTQSNKIPVKEVDSVMVALMKREQLGSTGIGGGVAVPHTKHGCVSRLVVTVARSEEGIDFDALDGEPVHLVFLLLSPNETAGAHLQALERIATLIRDSDFRRFMTTASDKKEMIDILREVDGHPTRSLT